MTWLVPWQKSLAHRDIYVQAGWADSQTKALGLASAAKITLPDSLPPPRLPLRKVLFGYVPTGTSGSRGPTTSASWNPSTAYRVQ